MTIRNIHSAARLGTLAAVIGALMSPAAAQQTRLDEIVVTARQKAESVQEIPIAVTAFSEEDMRRRSIQGLEDVARFTSSFTFEDFGGGFGTPVIRSASQTRLTALEQNVATFWDGIYVPRGWAINTGVSSLSRIEVVKGPQSARYGRNAFMGAINYVPRQPTDEFEAEVTGTVGLDDRLDYGGYLSGSIVDDRLTGYLGFNVSEFDGSWKNIHPNANVDLGDRGTKGNAGGWHNKSWSAALDFKATDTLSFNAAYYYFDMSEENRGATQLLELQGATNCGSIGIFGTPRLICGELPSPPDTIAVDPRSYGRQAEVDIYRCGFDWEISDVFQLSYFFGRIEGDIDIGSLSEADNINCGTNFGSPGLCRFQNTPLGGVEFDQHEIRLSSDAGGALSYSVGVFYSDEEDLTLFAIPAVPALGTDPIVQAPLIRNGTTLTETVAYFGEFSYRFDDRWLLSVEGRYSDEEKTEVNNVNGAVFTDTFKNFTPRVSLEYALNEDQLVYASVAQGVKSGGFNPTAVLESDRTFDEEKNWTMELGSKNVFLDGNLVLNAAVFYIRWEDIQLNASDSGAVNPNAVNITLNLGDATSYGIEFDAAYQVTENFLLNATLSLVDATYDSGTIDNRFARVGPGFFPNPASCDDVVCPSNGDISGNEVERQAPLQVSVGAEWNSSVANWGGDVYVRGDVSYQSKREAESMNLSQIEARTISNASIGFVRPDWDVSLWVRNLTDERYITNSFVVLLPFGNGYGSIFGERRTAGITARYRF